jgi:hypothetical protein
MGATRIRYLLNQWRLRSLALSRLESGLPEDGRNPPWKPSDSPPPPKPLPEEGPEPE